MSLKRQGSFPNVFPSRKRRVVKATGSRDDKDEDKETDLIEIPNDTKAALLFLKSLFPVQAFNGQVPPILLKHQLYCVVNDKTTVDRQLNKMWETNEVRLFKLVTGSDEFAVMLTSDYISHLRSKMTNNTTNSAEKFIANVLPSCVDVSFSRKTLSENHSLTEEEITQLINLGALAVRDVGSWWLSIPGAGHFMKSFSKGRKAVIRTIKNTKYKEMLQKELESRNLSTHSKLGVKYHIYDIIGAELVQRIDTTSGPLLRLRS
ncbi:serine/threonine-protein kinase 19 [Nematostella vectensis]|uniref:serine/threonine-protein kinase 19 n=1 Tax=Nematostella vectensis TaxID=45351 RepID=UPI0013903E16|nr:serine/threonine-protein kinase 19 [Nematostella vectensis]